MFIVIFSYTDTSPLLMVAGGYNRDLPNGLTRDVELISTIPRNQCSKRVRPLKATVIYEFNNRRETDADILGMTGQVIFCFLNLI